MNHLLKNNFHCLKAYTAEYSAESGLLFKKYLLSKNTISSFSLSLLIFFSCFFSLQLKASKEIISPIDSLQNLLKSAQLDTNKVIFLNALSLEFSKDSPENAILYATQALTLSNELSYKRGIAKSLSYLGYAYKLKNNVEKALEYNIQALEIRKTLKNKTDIINSLCEIAALYRKQKNFDKAMEFYLTALSLSEENSMNLGLTQNLNEQTKSKKQEGRINYLIGNLYQNQINYDNSLKYFFQALQLYKSINDENGIAEVSLSIGTVYYDRSNPHDKVQTFVFKGLHKEAMEYASNAKKIFLKNNNKNGIIRADNYLAYISAGQEEFDKALEYAFEGLKISKENKDEEMETSFYGTIGDIYYSHGNYSKALEYTDRCYKGANAINNKEYIRDIYLSYASIYAKLDNYQKAYEFHKLYSGMKDVLLNEQSNKQITEMNAKYDSEKKDKELIKKDAELAQQLAQTDQQQTIRNALIVGFALVLILAFFIYTGYRSKQKSNINITKQKEELEKSYKNISILGDIEQEITSSITIEKIIEKVYENVNKLMSADIFCIGIHNEKNNSIDFPGFIEKGKKYNSSYDLNDNTRFPVICFKNKQEIFINDLEKEFQEYIPYIPAPIAGERPTSIIYLPLLLKEKTIGVITVESFSKNAYNQYHLNILKNLAVYVAIALENAQLYANLEEKIKERTEELLKQKEEVEKSYENTKLLSNIGREISSVLSVEEITNKVYENVNRLMDASVFGIGIFNETDKRIEFQGLIEKGKKLPIHYDEFIDDYQLSIWCFKKQQEIFINNFQKEYPNYFQNKPIPEPKQGEDTESIIYLPLSTPYKVIGVITVQSFNSNAYSHYHLNILRNLAIYVVNALENARLYGNMEEEVKHRTQEVIKQKEELEISNNDINILSEIGKQLTSTLDFENIFIKLHESINRLMDAETFGVRIYHSENNTVEIKYEYDKGKRLTPFSFSIENNDNYSVWCIKNKKEIFVNDNENEYKNYVKSIVTTNGEITKSMLFCPMILKENVIGVITVQSYKKNRYTKHHLDILRTLANYTAIALENAQLYENLEEKIEERTAELLMQKEEVEKSYENTKLLSDIGREIASVLSVEEILKKVYENVNKLMDASAFGIGMFNDEEKRLDFSGFIEKGERLPFYYIAITEEVRPAIWCFKKQQEIVINDFQKEYNNYFPNSKIPEPKEGEQPESMIYLPLSISNKRIGVITVQSFKKNAYTEYQLNILRNLAIYVVSGLENARLYENMEEEVKARTLEIEKQKNELARLSIVASETDNGVLIFGATREIEWINAAFTRLQGFTLEDLKQNGNTIEKISNNPEIESLIKKCILTKKSSVYQAFNITKDKKELWIQSSVTPILDVQGNINKWVIIDIDVTDRKKAEDDIRMQNEKITDSINYAKSIQEALLPSIEEIKKHVSASFILYKPKDIVSGDFYWIYEDEKRIFIAAADCTGHGVPGAFMSLMGNNFLNDIIKVKGMSKPSEILDELNIQILNTLKQNSKATSVKYGMDMALICLENEESKTEKYSKSSTSYKLQYAGAHSPLLIFRGDECMEIKADKRSIGSFKKEDELGFMNHSIQLMKGDMLYMFSDGYADQIGGSENKKIFSQPFRDILQSICQQEISEQKKILEEKLIKWKGNQNQTDDILVVGIRV